MNMCAHKEMHCFVCMIACQPSNKKTLNKLQQHHVDKVLNKDMRGPATLYCDAQTLKRCLYSESDLAAPSKSQQLLLLQLSSTISFSLHQQHTAAFSHLAGEEGKFPTFFMKKKMASAVPVFPRPHLHSTATLRSCSLSRL